MLPTDIFPCLSHPNCYKNSIKNRICKPLGLSSAVHQRPPTFLTPGTSGGREFWGLKYPDHVLGGVMWALERHSYFLNRLYFFSAVLCSQQYWVEGAKSSYILQPSPTPAIHGGSYACVWKSKLPNKISLWWRKELEYIACFPDISVHEKAH